MSTQETLSRFWNFEHLSAESLCELAASFRERKLATDSPVFRLGETAGTFNLIVEGAVVLIRDAVARPVELLARLGPGDFFGEGELLDGRPRSTSARTTEPTRLLVIDREPFLAFLGSQPLLRLRLERAARERASARSSAAALERSVRRDVRIPIGREVILELPGGTRVPCNLDNLSLGGVALDGAPKDWRIRKQVLFRLGLAEKPDLLDLSGVVTWRKGSMVGIAFRDPTPELRVAISQAFQELLSREAVPG